MLQLLVKTWFEPITGQGARLQIRGLTGVEMITAMDLMAKSGITLDDLKAAVETGRLVLAPDVVRYVIVTGVVDWQGVAYDGAPESPFTAGAGADLPDNVVTETVNEILARSVQDPAAEKNLSSPRKSGSTPTSSIAAPVGGDAIATKAIPLRGKNSSFPASSPARLA